MELKENKYVDINPITKGKRMLIFLGDFFINFIVAFVFFGVMVTPLAKLVTNFDAKSELFEAYEKDRIDILYDNELIYYEDEVNKYNEHIYMKHTYDRFLSYYVLTKEISFELTNENYGKYPKNEVVKHYYIDVRNTPNKYNEIFDKYNNKVGYFIKDDNNYILKEEYRSTLEEYFNPMGQMSDVGLTLYDDVASEIFFALFGEILTDINKKDVDLQSNNYPYSYNEYSLMAEEIRDYHVLMLSISALISYVLSTLLVYLLYPILTKTKRSPTMSICKIDRININDFNKPKNYTLFTNFIYSLVLNLPYVMFLPATLVPFTYIFTFYILVTFSFISLLFILISFIFLLFNDFVRSLSDRFTKTVLISEADLYEIYKAKGYFK